MKTLQDLNNLPEDIKAKVLSTLIAYNEVHVIFENQQYHVSPDYFLSSTYAKDRKFIGEWSYSTLAEELPELKQARRDYLTECGCVAH